MQFIARPVSDDYLIIHKSGNPTVLAEIRRTHGRRWTTTIREDAVFVDTTSCPLFVDQHTAELAADAVTHCLEQRMLIVLGDRATPETA